MPKPAIATVDAYLAAQPAPTRKTLERVRSAVRKALPGCEETISYGMPTYKRDGRAVFYFAAWLEHFAVYPAYAPVVEAVREDLARIEGTTVAKGTIRFPLGAAVPVTLIARIAKLLAEHAPKPAAKSKATSAKKRNASLRKSRASGAGVVAPTRTIRSRTASGRVQTVRAKKKASKK